MIVIAVLLLVLLTVAVFRRIGAAQTLPREMGIVDLESEHVSDRLGIEMKDWGARYLREFPRRDGGEVRVRER